MQAYYNPRKGIRLGRDLSRQSLPKWEELKRTNAARRRQEMHREYSVLSAFRDLRSKVSRGPAVRIFRVSVQNPTEACQLLRCLANPQHVGFAFQIASPELLLGAKPYITG